MSLIFKPKEYLRPNSEEEMSALLKQYGERARIIAGGTGIYEVAHRGLLSDIEILLDINGLSLSYIHVEDSILRIGASTRMNSLAFSSEMEKRIQLGAIADALRAIQPMQVKNVATIGGAVCTALPFFDLPVALFCLDASVLIAPAGKSTKIPDFIQGFFAIDLLPGEFVKELTVPLVQENYASAFKKFALTGDDWAMVNCAVRVRLDGDLRISDAFVVFGGGVGEKPIASTVTSRALLGTKALDEDEIKKVIEKWLPSELNTVSDLRASADYRMSVAKVICKRTVIEACKRALFPDLARA